MSKTPAKLVKGDTKPTSHRAWFITIVIALVCGFLFLKPFISLILLSALLSYITFPIYDWFMRKWKGNQSLAATMTTLILFLILAVPVAIILIVAVSQALNLVDQLGISKLISGNTNFEALALDFTDKINHTAESITGNKELVSTNSIENFVKSTLPGMIKTLTNSILALAASIPSFFVNLIIFLFLYTGFLVNGRKLISTLNQLSPYSKEINDLYFNRVGVMAKAMIKGQFLIAFAQGLATAAGLAIVGLGEYFFFFTLIFSFMSIIPLGAGIITIPMGIIALATGNVSQGVIILVNHFLVVSSIDNIRPKLVPKEAQLPAALTILAAFSGVAMFGLLGVIYGPIIMIVIVTTIETYLKASQLEQTA